MFGRLRRGGRLMSWLVVMFSVLLVFPAAAMAQGDAPQTSPAAGPRQNVRLLHIGNSFSMDATRFLPGLAKAGGKDLMIYGAVISSSSLEVHATRLAQAKAGDPAGSVYRVTPEIKARHPDIKIANLTQALSSQPWDVVTIQQVSHLSGQPKSHEPFAGQLITEIREQAPEATILVHQTWPFRIDQRGFRSDPQGMRQRMHQSIITAYTELAQRYQLGLIPAGNAIVLAGETERWRHTPDPDFDHENPPADKVPVERGLYVGYRLVKNKNGESSLSNDIKHLSPAGQYLAGCVWYEIIFNDSVLMVDFTPPGLTPEEAAQLRTIAHQAVAEYREHGLKGR